MMREADDGRDFTRRVAPARREFLRRHGRRENEVRGAGRALGAAQITPA